MTTTALEQHRRQRLSVGALRAWLIVHREALLIAGLLLVAGLAHGVNMFDFPYYEDDEGTYMSQAWAVVHQGRLAPYTYWYDHAPLGWIQIAGWTVFTGGIHTFGSAIASGRVLMLLLQLGSVFMVYRIARGISGSVLVATLSALLFGLSAYGTYYHRRILLDNIATFWMLLAILCLVSGRLSLKRVWLSGLALGISILSKELTIFLVPVLIYLVFYRADRSQRWFATVGWLALVGSVFSGYLLMATLKSELFPTGTLLGGLSEHVSLLETLKNQASRGKDGGLFDLNSGFWRNTTLWIRDEPLLVVAGSACAAISALLVKRQRLVGVLGAITLSLWAFIGRGGETIGFYLVPLLPLLALNIGLVLGLVNRAVIARLPQGIGASRAGYAIRVLLATLVLGGILAGYFSPDLGLKRDPLLLWHGEEAVAQRQASAWAEENLPSDSYVIIDMYMWADLHAPGQGRPPLTHAHYYWKVDFDPEITEGVLHGDWRSVDYVIVTPQMTYDAEHVTGMDLVVAMLAHSTPIARFDTGGWPVEVRRVERDT